MSVWSNTACARPEDLLQYRNSRLLSTGSAQRSGPGALALGRLACSFRAWSFVAWSFVVWLLAMGFAPEAVRAETVASEPMGTGSGAASVGSGASSDLSGAAGSNPAPSAAPSGPAAVPTQASQGEPPPPSAGSEASSSRAESEKVPATEGQSAVGTETAPLPAPYRPDLTLLPPDPALTLEGLWKGLEERDALVRKAREEALSAGYLLSYVREIYQPGLLLVNHLLYAWDAEHMRLEIKVLEGQGKSSLSVLSAKKAAIRVDEQWTPVSAAELKARLNTYRLENLLRLQVSLMEQVKGLGSRDAWRYLGQVRDMDGVMCPVLGIERKARGEKVWFVLEPRALGLRRVINWQAGNVVEFTYSDVRMALPGLELPFRMEHRNNGQMEDVVRLQRAEVLARGWGGLLEVELEKSAR